MVIDPPPEAEAELDLWASLKTADGPTAREKLFAFYAGFARRVARRHYRSVSRGDLDIGELYQLAYAGLLEAIDRFEVERNVPFRSFAGYRILGSLRDGIAQMSEYREQVSWQARLRRERTKSLTDGAQDSPSQNVQKLLEIAVGLALGFMLEGTGICSEESGPAPPSAYESAAWMEMLAHLKTELAGLPEREQSVLKMHYLAGQSFDIIASVLGVTKGRISQIHRSALLQLHKQMRSRGHFRLER